MPCPQRHSRSPAWMVALVCCCLFELTGCSLFVMAGKMLQGDPVIPDEFKESYGQSMNKSGKKVAVLCSTPEAVKSEFSSLDLDLAAEITGKLKLHHIEVVKAHKVANWVDDHGGGDVDLKEFGADIDADLVIQVVLEHFDYREENSPDLFRGRARGSVTVHELVRGDEKSLKFESKPKSKSDPEAPSKDDKTKLAKDEKSTKSKKDKAPALAKVNSIRPVYYKTFDSVYPQHQPMPIGQMKADSFRKKFLDRVGDELSRLFYSHKPGTDI